MEVNHEKCGKCKYWRLPVEFLNDRGRQLKTCSKCRALGRRNKYTIEECREFAITKNGECLSNTYVNNRTYLK